ncbi:MAG: MmcB family DNA repair protein [Paenirhodobacter sp.]|uniref:MmcB family DNA repair protein n=1 Tax=Paenirhodobacter sp. TaxID=1965326 RepID=UPI003D0DEBB8
MTDALTPPPLTPGQLLARGAARLLADHGFACVAEFVPRPGLRVDVMALGRGGELWVVECKSGRADFAADHKWQNYIDYADRFFWAVDEAFPTEILPEGTGLIVADRFGGEILRYGPEAKLAAARRRALTLGFARTAALRLQGRADPAAPSVPGRLSAFL